MNWKICQLKKDEVNEDDNYRRRDKGLAGLMKRYIKCVIVVPVEKRLYRIEAIFKEIIARIL